MTFHEWILLLQSNIAKRAVGHSSLRGAPTGSVFATREYLATVDLTDVAGNQYAHWLNARTQELLGLMPPTSMWGQARKSLNLFMRDCIYNHQLRGHYDLSSVEADLEVPLDSFVGKHIAGHRPDAGMRWMQIKTLSEADSEKWQKLAKDIAEEKKVSRVDLDVVFWAVELDDQRRR